MSYEMRNDDIIAKLRFNEVRNDGFVDHGRRKVNAAKLQLSPETTSESIWSSCLSGYHERRIKHNELEKSTVV